MYKNIKAFEVESFKKRAVFDLAKFIHDYIFLRRYLRPYNNSELFKKVLAQKPILPKISKYIELSPELRCLTRQQNKHLKISLLLENYYISWASGQSFTTLDVLKNYLNDSVLRQLIQFVHRLERRDAKFNSYTNLVKFMVSLTVQQKEEYLSFIKQRKFPVYKEDFLTSDVFIAQYMQIAPHQQKEFMEEVLLMNKWFLFNEKLLNIKDISLSEKELFEKIEILKLNIPLLRKNYFLSTAAGLKKEMAKKLKKDYTLSFFPGKKYSIEDFFNFINSDNISFFKTFSYDNFQPTCSKFIRKYDGLPLSVLHATRNGVLLAEDGFLRAGGKEGSDTVMNKGVKKRNKKYIFFGSLWDHFSRTPACREVDRLYRFYGETVIEYPLEAINKNTNTFWALRGNFYQSFETNIAKDADGDPVPYDIVETDRSQLPLSEAVRIYCGSAEQLLFWKEYKKKNNISADILMLAEARDIAQGIYEEAKSITEKFIKDNKKLINSLNEKNQKLEQYLLKELDEIIILSSPEIKERLRQFVHEYSCVIFSDFL